MPLFQLGSSWFSRTWRPYCPRNFAPWWSGCFRSAQSFKTLTGKPFPMPGSRRKRPQDHMGHGQWQKHWSTRQDLITNHLWIFDSFRTSVISMFVVICQMHKCNWDQTRASVFLFGGAGLRVVSGQYVLIPTCVVLFSLGRMSSFRRRRWKSCQERNGWQKATARQFTNGWARIPTKSPKLDLTWWEMLSSLRWLILLLAHLHLTASNPKCEFGFKIKLGNSLAALRFLFEGSNLCQFEIVGALSYMIDFPSWRLKKWKHVWLKLQKQTWPKILFRLLSLLSSWLIRRSGWDTALCPAVPTCFGHGIIIVPVD